MNWLTAISNWTYERLTNGQVWYTVGNGDKTWTLGNKVEALLDNPVTFTCTDILADLFCQFKPQINGEDNDNHWLVQLLNDPNPYQSKQDLLKEFIFFKQAEGWVFQLPRKLAGFEYDGIYNLNPSKVSYHRDFPTRMLFGKDAKEIKKKQFKYEEAHQKRLFDLKDIIPFFDIANGLSDDFLLKSPSRLKTVQREIRNINAAKDAKFKAIQKAGRFIVSGAQKGQHLTGMPMDPNDKKAIEGSFDRYGLNNVKGDIIATNSQVSVHDLSIALKNLGLDESVMNDAMFILNTWRTPLEMFVLSTSGSTFENQKTAVINYIQTYVQKHVDDYCNSLNSYFGLKGNETLTGTLDHLSVMQYIEEMKADKAFKLSAAIRNLSGTNIDPNQFLESQGINI